MATTKNKRLMSLDVLRGLTVALMIMVNNGAGPTFHQLQHSKWNGVTLCDLVFPFFLFIMGVSTYLSLKKYNFKIGGAVSRKIVKRTALLFLIGLLINWFDKAVGGDLFPFDSLRIWGVMQRIAICYCVVSFLALTLDHKYAFPITAAALLVIYSLILVFGNGYAYDESNILAVVDRSLIGYEHLYHKSPVDPEGLLSTIPAIAHVMIGFYCGKKMSERGSTNSKVKIFAVIGIILVVSGLLLQFALPMNKRVWSPSYVLFTCGLASLLQSLLMYVIDIRKSQSWTMPCLVFGTNPLFLYVFSEFLAIIFGEYGIKESIHGVISGVVSIPEWASLTYAVFFLLLNFAIGYVLYKRKIFIKL